MRLRAPRLVVSALALSAWGPGACVAAPAQARSTVVSAGQARFEVLTSTLIRAEYAQDGVVENRPTMTATRTRLPVPRFAVSRSHGWLVIRTAKARLRYRLGSGQFGTANLTLTFSGAGGSVVPTPGGGAGNLGGWRRALDLLAGPVALNNGLLARSGWYVLDDTDTALLTPGSPGFAVRGGHAGAYQDWYVFAYGHDFARALRDLRALTGPAPLLPRSAFGVWFSRYWPYSAQDYHGLLGQFRSQRVPLDTVSIDTDFASAGMLIFAFAEPELPTR